MASGKDCEMSVEEVVAKLEAIMKPLRWAWAVVAALLCCGFAAGKGYMDVTYRINQEETATKEQKTINKQLSDTLSKLDKTLTYYQGVQEGKAK